MATKLRHDGGRHPDLTHTRTGLRGPAFDQHPADLAGGTGDADEAVAQVEVVSAQLDQFPPAQSGERCHENKRSTPWTPGLRDGVDLIDRRHRPFRAPVLVGALDPARLRNGRGTRPRIQQVTTPAPNPSWRQVHQIEPTDPGVDL